MIGSPACPAALPGRHVAALLALGLPALVVAGGARADGCGCLNLPLAGNYATPDGPVTIAYLDGDGEQCPTQMRLTAPRREAPDADVILTCDGTAFTGIEPTRAGPFGWRVTGQPLPMEEGGEGIWPASELAVRLTIPPALGGGARDLPPIRATQGKAPLCLCELARLERDFAAEMASTYGRPDLRMFAREQGMRGTSNARRFAIDGAGRFQKLGAPPGMPQAYIDLIDGLFSGAIDIRNNEMKMVADQQTVAQDAAQRGTSGAMLSSAAAETNPVSCDTRYSTDACSAGVYVAALHAHEGTHAATCRRINAIESFTWIDGTSMAYPTGVGKMHEGYALPPSPYDAWSQDIDNQADDEVAAYSAELPIYDAFLARYCGG